MGSEQSNGIPHIKGTGLISIGPYFTNQTKKRQTDVTPLPILTLLVTVCSFSNIQYESPYGLPTMDEYYFHWSGIVKRWCIRRRSTWDRSPTQTVLWVCINCARFLIKKMCQYVSKILLEPLNKHILTPNLSHWLLSRIPLRQFWQIREPLTSVIDEIRTSRILLSYIWKVQKIPDK